MNLAALLDVERRDRLAVDHDDDVLGLRAADRRRGDQNGGSAAPGRSRKEIEHVCHRRAHRTVPHASPVAVPASPPIRANRGAASGHALALSSALLRQPGPLLNAEVPVAHRGAAERAQGELQEDRVVGRRRPAVRI